VLSLSLLANQIAAGLALTIFGHGFAALLGAGYVGVAGPTLPPLTVPLLSQIPFFGPVLFNQNILIYFSFAMLFGISWFLRKTHAGLILRAVGDSHDAAHAMGYSVIPIRYAAVAFGGAMAGIAGAYLFGGITYLSLYLQGLGVPIPSPLISALPYIGTVVVLVIISRDRRRIRLNQPACLGKYFHAVA